jgi:hypothetical protein
VTNRMAIFILVSAVLAGLRLDDVRHEAFQAAAHLWVGALCYGWLADRRRAEKWLAITLSVIEVGKATADHWGQLVGSFHRLFGG